MVQGIESFKKHFEGMEKQYTIIGGTACDLLMSEAGEDFRATRDIDIVLIIESLSAEFAKKFWQYIIEADYEHKNKSTQDVQFYRFKNPKTKDYPSMIEIFSRKPDALILPEDAVITPLHISDEVSSLSAILLNEEYYEFIKNGIVQIEGIAILDAVHLIPLKVKAWSDLSEKKAKGTSVDSKDVKKHKNDVYRLCTLLTPETQMEVPANIYNEVQNFIEYIKTDDIDLRQLGIRGMTKENMIAILTSAYVRQI